MIPRKNWLDRRREKSGTSALTGCSRNSVLPHGYQLDSRDVNAFLAVRSNLTHGRLKRAVTEPVLTT